jgi:catechol 2,3-dioxygenase-like lactoylglutathione lyase family enzyme
MIGADRQTSVDFWEGVLGMPLIFEQPNLDVPEQNHLYFDPGDGRLITVFTDERRTVDSSRNPEGIGNLHHLAFTVSRATYTQIAQRLDERGISHTGNVDRGFMDSIYFRDPLGQLLECACYKFEPPTGTTHVDVLWEAHVLRVARGDHHIADDHLADAIELLATRNQPSLSSDRSPKDPYVEKPPVWD